MGRRHTLPATSGPGRCGRPADSTRPRAPVGRASAPAASNGSPPPAPRSCAPGTRHCSPRSLPHCRSGTGPALSGRGRFGPASRSAAPRSDRCSRSSRRCGRAFPRRTAPYWDGRSVGENAREQCSRCDSVPADRQERRDTAHAARSGPGTKRTGAPPATPARPTRFPRGRKHRCNSPTPARVCHCGTRWGWCRPLRPRAGHSADQSLPPDGPGPSRTPGHGAAAARCLPGAICQTARWHSPRPAVAGRWSSRSGPSAPARDRCRSRGCGSCTARSSGKRGSAHRPGSRRTTTAAHSLRPTDRAPAFAAPDSRRTPGRRSPGRR